MTRVTGLYRTATLDKEIPTQPFYYYNRPEGRWLNKLYKLFSSYNILHRFKKYQLLFNEVYVIYWLYSINIENVTNELGGRVSYRTQKCPGDQPWQ